MHSCGHFHTSTHLTVALQTSEREVLISVEIVNFNQTFMTMTNHSDSEPFQFITLKGGEETYKSSKKVENIKFAERANGVCAPGRSILSIVPSITVYRTPMAKNIVRHYNEIISMHKLIFHLLTRFISMSRNLFSFLQFHARVNFYSKLRERKFLSRKLLVRVFSILAFSNQSCAVGLQSLVFFGD